MPGGDRGRLIPDRNCGATRRASGIVKTLGVTLTAIAALTGGVRFAHHSFAMPDADKGTLLKFTYLNPHS